MKKQHKYHSHILFIPFIIIFAVLLSFIFSYNLIVSAANITETKQYLSLGDSIATGYGLKNAATEKYSSLLTKELSKDGANYELLNYAKDGIDSSDLLKQLSDTSNKNLASAVSSASVITVSIGGNNFLKPLTDVFSNMGSGSIPGNININPEQIDESMITFYINMLFTPGTKEYNELTKALDKACDQFKSDLEKIINILNKNKNKNAQIIFLTVYNPYKDFSKIKNFYDTAELYIKKINGMIEDKSKGNYIVSDIYTTFKNSTQTVVNASMSSNISNINIDPHPNAAGHKLIYKSIFHSLGLSLYFDDMSNDTWAVEYVDDLYERLIIFGTSNGKFSPKLELKNCDLAVMLARTLKLKTGDADVANVKLPFSDISKIPDYALNYVKACYKAGLYNDIYPGSGGKTYAFAPDKSARRIDVALMAVQLINKSKWSAKKPVYTDLKGVDEKYYPALSTLYEYKIMEGFPDKTLKPFDALTRAQVASILWKILNNPEITAVK